ncbi:MAG: hypothetical protein JNM96_09095 [Bacteroidia bacterium]|nr:hypothetical protein [Bacteroidia bacterium]
MKLNHLLKIQTSINMRTHVEIKKIVSQLEKKAQEHQRKIDIINRIKYIIKQDANKTANASKT